ncbi:MAG: hypothetical protein AAF720_03355 [Pseudomonadota bacterium]
MRFKLLAITVLSLPACATNIVGGTETATFQSRPPGAEVMLHSATNKAVESKTCTTPCTLKLPRHRTWQADFSYDGYKPVSGLLIPTRSSNIPAKRSGHLLASILNGLRFSNEPRSIGTLSPNPLIADLAPNNRSYASRIIDPTATDSIDNPLPYDVIDEPQFAEESIEDAPIRFGATEGRLKLNDDRPIANASVSKADMKTAPTYLTEGIEEYAEGERQQREYYPGEPAPHDEISSELNRRVLQTIEKR